MNEPDAPRDQSRPALPDALRERKPWPMWPIALAILVFIPVYTFINLKFRKQGPAFEPAADWRSRQEQAVDKNLYDWYRLRPERAARAEPIGEPAEIAERANDQPLELSLPEQLVYYLASEPLLVPFPVRAESPRAVAAGEPLRLRLWLPAGLADDERFRLQAYYKDGALQLLASLYAKSLADLEPSLFEGERELCDFELPTGPIEADSVHARLHSAGRIAEWTIAFPGRGEAGADEAETLAE